MENHRCAEVPVFYELSRAIYDRQLCCYYFEGLCSDDYNGQERVYMTLINDLNK